MFLGNGMFHALGITQADFRIAGGILLLVLAIIDLLIRGKPAVDEDRGVGIFPLAMPLIAGPATLTTTLVLAGKGPHGYSLTSLSLVVNLSIVILALLYSSKLSRLVGANAMRAVSKLVMVLLAAIAVHLIRTGISEAFGWGG
jgi:multiple antibiotic resistance protein